MPGALLYSVSASAPAGLLYDVDLTALPSADWVAGPVAIEDAHGRTVTWTLGSTGNGKCGPNGSTGAEMQVTAATGWVMMAADLADICTAAGTTVDPDSTYAIEMTLAASSPDPATGQHTGPLVQWSTATNGCGCGYRWDPPSAWVAMQVNSPWTVSRNQQAKAGIKYLRADSIVGAGAAIYYATSEQSLGGTPQQALVLDDPIAAASASRSLDLDSAAVNWGVMGGNTSSRFILSRIRVRETAP